MAPSVPRSLINITLTIRGRPVFVFYQEEFQLQWNAVIMQSNITWYCTHQWSDWGRIWMQVKSHKRHPIPRPNGRATRCFCDDSDIVHINVVTGAEYECKFKPTKDIPYLALMGELRGVFFYESGENWPFYNGTTLYLQYDSVKVWYKMQIYYSCFLKKRFITLRVNL